MKFTVDVAIGIRRILASSKMSNMKSEDKIVAIKIIKVLKSYEDEFEELRKTIAEKIDNDNKEDVQKAQETLHEELNKEVTAILPKFDNLDDAMEGLFLSNPDMIYSDIERLEYTLNKIYSSYETSDKS